MDILHPADGSCCGNQPRHLHRRPARVRMGMTASAMAAFGRCCLSGST